MIRPREPGVMADGYVGMAETTLESRRNLWFHTGDIGRLDEDGRFLLSLPEGGAYPGEGRNGVGP